MGDDYCVTCIEHLLSLSLELCFRASQPRRTVPFPQTHNTSRGCWRPPLSAPRSCRRVRILIVQYQHFALLAWLLVFPCWTTWSNKQAEFSPMISFFFFFWWYLMPPLESNVKQATTGGTQSWCSVFCSGARGRMNRVKLTTLQRSSMSCCSGDLLALTP